MNVVIMDRDEMAANLLYSKLKPFKYTVEVEADKKKAVDFIHKHKTDFVFLDPAPMKDARPVVLNIRRGVENYPYIFLLSEKQNLDDALKLGVNDTLPKPFDPEVFDEKMGNAKRLVELVARLNDEREDFPSAGGVIAKSAFNQLFLSAIDRADRYSERTYLLFISMENYQEILDKDGQHAADFAVSRLSQYLVLLRRQSDIIGQTAKHEYALLLQRPSYEQEPFEAAMRFAETLSQYDDIASPENTPAEINVSLIDLPAGQLLTEHVFMPGKK